MFEKPEYLWVLLIVFPLNALFAYAIWLINRFEGKHLQNLLAYSRVPSYKRRILCSIAYILAIELAAAALASPYIMVNAKDKEYQNIRLIFVVDVSKSMVYADDVPPNRLKATKREIRNFYNSLDGVYECSILPFAGDANPYFCPLTNHRSSFLQMLDELDWQSAPTWGTDLTKAMQSVQDIYVNMDRVDKSGLNVLILFSDGGKEEALSTNRVGLVKLTRDIASKNFKIYTVGVGGKEPCPLIIRDSQGGFIQYATENGRKAYSQMDEEILRQVAEIGNGKYYHLNASAELSYDLKEVIKENRKLVSERTRDEKFYLQPYLFAVTVCLLFFCLFLNKV